MWVTEFTWSRGDIDDPNHELHAKQLENYYRYRTKNILIIEWIINQMLFQHIAKNKQIDVQPGKHKWILDVALLKWKGF